MAVTDKQIETLRPLLEGSGPNHSGWWQMHCPYHGDENRSAGINVEEEFFNCFGCEVKTSVRQLIKDKPKWVMPNTVRYKVNGHASYEEINEAKISGWHSSLLSNQRRLDEFMRRRGINIHTIENYELGWDNDKKAYTIPIRGIDGEILNVRRYQLDPTDGRRKIWSVTGMGTPVLWPMDQLDYDSIIICEGELDALITIQHGFPAITRTGTADTWQKEWSYQFSGKNVYLIHDMDTKGQTANDKLVTALRRHARRTTVVHLPYPVTPDHGKDLTDFFQEGNTARDLRQLIASAKEKYEQVKVPVQEQEPEEVRINVMESFDATMSERKLRMPVTIVGKVQPTYLVPEKIEFICNEADKEEKKCQACTLVNHKGEVFKYEIPSWSSDVIKFLNVPEEKLRPVIRKAAGVQTKCPAPHERIVSKRNVEELYVRPSLDEQSLGDQDFTHRKVISTAPSYDILSNQSVILTGTIRPHPRTQANEFQAWEIVRSDTGLDSFVLSDDMRKYLERKVQTDNPLEMCYRIADDMAHNHTYIFGRHDFHVFADLVFHSVLQIQLPGEDVEKGWLDCIAIGDTRTGKSAVSRSMLKLYGMGELTNCEAASFAGVVGGLDRPADGRWVVKWGSIPVNDRRAVVLDEVSGLSTDQIASMSDMRWSGMAQLIKIKSEKAHARTRLLWLGNPRGQSFDEVTYGTDALKKLIGNREDLARFDLAMGVFSSDVPSRVINKKRDLTKRKFMQVQAYQDLLKWVWTRKVEHIRWMDDADGLIRLTASELGQTYIEEPPLLQGANARGKIARLAAAFAARTFSTDDGIHLLVYPHHVLAAKAFIQKVYSHPKFGYGAVSKQKIVDTENAIANMDKIQNFLMKEQRLKRFLIVNPKFTRNTLMSMMAYTDDSVGTVLSSLWNYGALEMDGEKIRVNPVVLEELRGTLISDASTDD